METINTECQEFLSVLLIETLELFTCTCQDCLEESRSDCSVVIPHFLLEQGKACHKSTLEP